MSFAVHDSQPTQAWTGMHSKKRKHAVISRHENNEIHDLRSNTLESSRKEPTRVVYKRTTPTQSRGASPDSGVSTVNQFLIDGNAPVQPHPTLVAKKTEVRHGPGRHRSVDIKGLIMELIDETYPPTVCPTCLYTASGRSDADLHFKTEHHGNKAFKCVDPTCEQAYSSKPGLRYHLEHAHKVTLVSDTSER
ncbi:uncharacterized protein EV154DRAFT_527533 [Mucor mucedo]|uniref:uncharacterized protein n=1 Tax=Mucor mucedo TaxID=29922 RepID=UPI00221EEDC0|nr:uncharacterized protein EV154DRAFT_527533 [Mucor mucedo]KAI7873945.1 hypothetical protein EV154DRAFT_527533 [Mucor mucedo]